MSKTSINVDVTQLDDLDKDILKLVQETMPKECKKFMRREGGKLRTQSRRQGRAEIKTKTGNYIKGIKSTRSWKSKDGYGVKVIATAPHSHLLESGHEIWPYGRFPSGKRTRAFKIMEKGLYIFDGRFYADTSVFIDQMVTKGLEG